MTRYRVLHLRFEALSPLTFPTRKPGTQFQASLPYIPGAVVYGALGADDLIRPHLDQLRCRNAYPTNGPDASWVRPLPVTALKPKGSTGTPQDSLVGRVCWERQQPTALVYAPTDKTGRAWEASSGFYGYQGGTFRTHSVEQRIVTRVAINRERGVAEDTRLYSPLVLQEGSRFVGSIAVPEDLAVLATPPSTLRIGGRQHSGMGRVAIEQIAVSDEQLETTADAATALLNRIDQLTQRFQARAALYERLGGAAWEIKPRSIFTINLLSDALLLEHGWFPSQTLRLEELGLRFEATLLRAFTATQVMGGWNVQWQIAKPTALATRMGGLWVFEAERSLTEDDCTALLALQNTGVGERCAEGFGQVRICDEFHTRSEEI